MESPTSQQKETPPVPSGGVEGERGRARHGVIEAARRMNFWVPKPLYRQLEAEAAKEGMTLSAWVQVVLLKRPERVLERTVMPAGTRAKLAQVPVLEKRIATLNKGLEQVKLTLLAVRREVGDGVIHAKCPNCKQSVRMTMDGLARLLKQPVEESPKR